MAKKVNSVDTQSGDIAVQASGAGVTEEGNTNEGKTLSTEIARLTQAKADIKAAIEAKGVTVGNGTIDTYASKIGEISSGGGSTIEEGSSSLLICNFMFHPLAAGPTETCTDTSISGDVEGFQKRTDLSIKCTDNSNVNIKITRSTLDSKTKLRVCDVIVECRESDFFTIDILYDSLTKTQLVYYTNMSTVSGYEDFENHCFQVSVSGITQDIAFSTGCLNEM